MTVTEPPADHSAPGASSDDLVVQPRVTTSSLIPPKTDWVMRPRSATAGPRPPKTDWVVRPTSDTPTH